MQGPCSCAHNPEIPLVTAGTGVYGHWRDQGLVMPQQTVCSLSLASPCLLVLHFSYWQSPLWRDLQHREGHKEGLCISGVLQKYFGNSDPKHHILSIPPPGACPKQGQGFAKPLATGGSPEQAADFLHQAERSCSRRERRLCEMLWAENGSKNGKNNIC